MPENKSNAGLWLLFGGLVAAAIIALTSTEKRRTDEILDSFQSSLSSIDKKAHPGLYEIVKELNNMLKESINGNEFKMKYSMAFDMLIRSCYEQSVKCYLTINQITFRNKESLYNLENKAYEHAKTTNNDISSVIDCSIKMKVREF